MKDGKIIVHDASPKIDLKPESKYVASLYGEVNEIPLGLISSDIFTSESILVYSHELFLTDKSNLEVTVKHCYYKGNTFLIKGVYDKKVLFFENSYPLEVGENVFLKVDDEVVEFRK
jgi:ABC-type sulfate/molybdate transport systems ATPase subunit